MERTKMRSTHIGGLGLAIVLAASVSVAADGDVPLIEAVKRGDTAAVQSLLRRIDDVNRPAVDGSTALHWAAYREDVGTVELLIRSGANVKAANRHGVTALSLAALKGNASIIGSLLKAGADPNTALSEGETVLMTAARTGNRNAVQVLLDHGASVQAKEKVRGQTALMWAAAQGHADAVQLLVRAGADVKVRSKIAPRPPDRLGRAGATDGEPGAVSGGGAAGARGKSPVSRAPAGTAAPAANTPPSDEALAEPEDAKPDAAKVPAGRSANGGDPPGLTAFLFAVRAGHIGVSKALLEGGADVNEPMTDGTSALTVAIVNGRYELAKFLLDRGANPNAAAQGWTPLHQVLLTRRPSLFRPTPFPLPDVAVSDFDLMNALIERGADVNAVTTKAPRDGIRSIGKKIGATPFFLAAKGVDVEAMRFLVSKGADPLKPNVEGTTPAMAAAGVGIWRLGESPGSNDEALDAVKYLYDELRADVNTVDENGETAVHGAAHRGAPAIIQLLAARGANLDRTNKMGWTPLTIAGGVYYPNLYEQYPEAEAMLKKLGATAPGTRRPIDAQPQQAGAPVRP
jgi:ankyrin repeat protein